MVDIQSETAENRQGKKEEEETTAAEYNGLPYWVAIKSTAVPRMGGSRTLKDKNSSVDEITNMNVFTTTSYM